MREKKIDHDAIHTLQDLWVAGQRRQSVHIPGGSGLEGPKPAAFIMNLTGHVIMRMIERGLRVYRPAANTYEKVTGKPWPWGRKGGTTCTCTQGAGHPDPQCPKHGGDKLPW
jgi:hypothetical protein